MFIRSQRLFLRPYWPEDRLELQALAGERADAGMPLQAGWPAPGDIAPCEPEDRRCPRFLVTLPADGRIIGFAGLARIRGLPELALWIAPGFRSKGYATEAGRSLLCVARALGIERIFAHIDASNAVAMQMLARLSFKPTDGAMVHELGLPCGDDNVSDMLAA